MRITQIIMNNGECTLRLDVLNLELHPQMIDSWLDSHLIENETPATKESDIPKVGICWAPYG
jgi:hypothetical protein